MENVRAGVAVPDKNNHTFAVCLRELDEGLHGVQPHIGIDRYRINVEEAARGQIGFGITSRGFSDVAPFGVQQNE